MPIPKLILPLLVINLFLCGNKSFAQTGNNGTFYLYEDSTKKLTAENVLELYQQKKFRATTTDEINIGFTRSLFWLAFENDRQFTPDSLLLFIGHHHINRIHFFYVAEGNIQRQWITGDYFPFSQRPVTATGFYFPVNKKGLYLAQIDKSNESLQLSFRLIPQFEALSNESYTKSIMALFTGMILLLVVFGVYLFIISKRPVYGYYSLYIATAWLWVLANAGLGFQYLWPNLPWFASKSRAVFVASSLIFSLLFLLNFIGTIRNKKILAIIRGLNIFLTSWIIIIFFLNDKGYDNTWWVYIQYLVPLVSVFHLLITMGILITESLRGNRLAAFYLTAMSVLVVSIVLQVSYSMGALHGYDHFFGNFSLSLGIIMEAVILTAGIAYSFNQYRLDKERLLTEMYVKQVENTRIMMEVQQAERSQVANQLHDVAGSLLSAAKLNLSSLIENGMIKDERANAQAIKAEEAVSMVSDIVRNLSHALSPVMLEQVGFKTTLEKIVAIFNASGKIKIQLLVIGFEQYKPALNNYYTALYSIVYELLNNIVKHSFAANALLQATEDDDYFSLIAEDDGIGINDDQEKRGATMGMVAIQSKINHFGGNIAIDNLQPNGLLVTIVIPIINTP